MIAGLDIPAQGTPGVGVSPGPLRSPGSLGDSDVAGVYEAPPLTDGSGGLGQSDAYLQSWLTRLQDRITKDQVAYSALSATMTSGHRTAADIIGNLKA